MIKWNYRQNFLYNKPKKTMDFITNSPKNHKSHPSTLLDSGLALPSFTNEDVNHDQDTSFTTSSELSRWDKFGPKNFWTHEIDRFFLDLSNSDIQN